MATRRIEQASSTGSSMFLRHAEERPARAKEDLSVGDRRTPAAPLGFSALPDIPWVGLPGGLPITAADQRGCPRMAVHRRHAWRSGGRRHYTDEHGGTRIVFDRIEMSSNGLLRSVRIRVHPCSFRAFRECRGSARPARFSLQPRIDADRVPPSIRKDPRASAFIRGSIQSDRRSRTHGNPEGAPFSIGGHFFGIKPSPDLKPIGRCTMGLML
jgi:hypothetical protein